MWKDYFTQHPKSVGETYPEHLRIAGFAGIRLIIGGLACCLHGIFPFLFIHTASNTVKKIHQEMDDRKAKGEI